MLAVEIVLILIGVAFLLGSHFVEEKFSEKDLQEISKMSEAQLSVIVDKQLKSARVQVELLKEGLKKKRIKKSWQLVNILIQSWKQ